MHRQASNDAPWAGRVKVAFIAFAVIAGFFLLVEHRAHVYPYLPWLLLAACPLMHLFMHGRHGSHGDHHGPGSPPPRSTEDPPGRRHASDAQPQSSSAVDNPRASDPRGGTS